MAQIVDAAGRVTYRAGRYYGSPEDLARLGLTNPTPPVPLAPPPQLRPEPNGPPPLLQNGQPLTPPLLLQQPGLAEQIFSDLAAGKSTEQVAQERGMTREAVMSTLAGNNQPVVTQPTSDNGDVRTTVIEDAQGRTVTEYYDFQHGTYYTTVQQDTQSTPVANPVRDESGWKVEQSHDAQTGTNTTTRVDDLGTGERQTETSLANGTRVETTVAEDGSSRVFVTGPDGKTVELAPWQAAPGRPDAASPLVRPPELQNFVGPVASDKLLAVGGDQTIASIQNELAQGRSIEEIAEMRGISRDQVVASMQAAGLTVTDTQTSVGQVIEVTEPQGGQTTTYTHDYDHGSTNVTVTKPNGDRTSDAVDGNGVTSHTERNAKTGAQTTHEVDPTTNTTTDITIDADGRRTEVVKTKGADGSEQRATTVTFNGYQLITAPDGDKTLTNTKTGDRQTIKAGSVQDSFATLLMEATPNSADPEVARQGQAQKAFAESQLTQARLPDLEQQATQATQAREDAEGKYGTGRPAHPTLNPDGQVIDPIGQPPPGSPGELQPPLAGTQRTSTETPTAINGDNSVKWVPININGAWTWVHPDVAKAAAAEAAANSRVIEANSLITASESDLQVYAKTPEFNGAMRTLRSRVNEALAPHNLQWTPSTAPGTLADARHAQTLAHDAHGQASAARGHYDQAVTLLDQAINQQVAMPFYPDGTTPVATAAGSNYDYDAEVAKGKQARADINKLFSDVDLQIRAGDKAIIDFNVTMSGAIDTPPGTLAKGAQPVEIEIGGQKLQVAPEVAEAYNNSGDITTLSDGDKPIRVQVDVTRPDGTTGTEWRWVAPDLALQSIGVAQQLRLSEAYNHYFGAVQTDAELGVKLEDLQSRALADYQKRVPYQFDPDGYQNANGENTGKLLDSEVVVKDGKLMLRNTYENDVFTGEDGHVLEVALAVNPNDENYTDEMRARPLNQEWIELAGPSSDGNACVASPLSAAKSGVESAALEVNQLIHNGVTENLAAIEKQLPGLRTDYNQLVQTQGTGTGAPPAGTLAPGEAAVPIQIGGQTVKVAPDVAAQVQTKGPSALTESGKPVYVDLEIPSEDEDGSTTQLRGWVSPELALAGVRLTDAETQKSQLTQTRTMLDNSIAYNHMRLRNPELLTAKTGANEADYLERDEQGTLDGIYQGRYQNLLNAGFNNEFEALDDSELSQTIDRTAGIDPTTEDGRDARQKVIDEIRETGGDNAEVRVVPIFYSQEGSASHQTALYAVRTGDGTRYIDAAGQKFDSLEDFQDNNRQFSEHGKLIVPKNLDMTAGTDGRISLDVVQARNVSTWDKIVDPVVGVVGGVATVLSFTPLAPVAAPIAIGSGVYLGTRTVFKQADYLNHGGEWGDKESLMNMGMIAATALPVGGSILRSAGLVRAGIPFSRAMPGSIGALPMRSGSVTLAGREFSYTASPYATQVATYTRTAGGVNMVAHGLDATAMVVGAPLVAQSGADLVMHGGEMSGLDLANSVLGLGTGVIGTGAGVRTIASYRPGRGTSPVEASGQSPTLRPDAIILPGEAGGPDQAVVIGTGRSTPVLTPIAGRGNPDVMKVRAEDGQLVDAVVLGDQPASTDAVFVPLHGETPRPQDMAGKTHVLLRDPETGAPLILPWRSDGNSVPLGLVESRPMLPAGHRPKEIGPAPPTAHTLDQVRGMRQPDKWQAGEIYIQQLNGASGQRHFPVPLDPNGPFPVTRPGGRYVDGPVYTPRGIEAIEVKTYNLWTTISGAAQMKDVPLTRNIQEQINKDVALRDNVDGYEPRWVFLDAPPSAELVQALDDARIIANIYRHWTPPSAGAQATTASNVAPRVTQASVNSQSGRRLFIADSDGNVSRARFAVDGDGEITPVASEPAVVSEGSTVPASFDTSKFQYTSGKDRAPFPATLLETSPDGSVSLRQDGYEPQSAYLDQTPEGKPLTPEQIQARYQKEREYYSPLEMAERYGPNGPQPIKRSDRVGASRDGTAWDQLTKEQLQAIPETGTTAIDTTKLTPEQASWLTQAQIAALTRDQFGAFTVNHIEALTKPQVEAITPKQFEEMSAGHFRKFTLEQFGWMSADQTNALSVQQLTTFRAGYRKNMTPEQRNLVDGALAYSRAKEHQMALDTFGTLASSSYLMWSSLPPHWMATAGGVSFAFRGVTFTAQSLFPNATASHTRLGRAINLTNGLSFVMSSPGSAAPLIQDGANPAVNGTFTLGNMIYGTKSTMQGFMGRTAMRLLGDHVGNIAYLGGSIVYTAQNLHSPIGWTSGALFALGSGEFWASAIRTDRLNGKPLPRTEADIAAAAKSDRRWAIADRLALGITFGGGMFLFAWASLASEPQDAAGMDVKMPGAPDDPPETNVDLDPDKGVATPNDTPPQPDPADKGSAEPQFAVTSEIGLGLRESPVAHAARLGIVRPDALVRQTGPRQTDASGTTWAPVRAFDNDGKELQGWVRADYLVAHPEGGQDLRGRLNPELEKEGYQAIIVQSRDSMIGLAINHQKSVSETVALNLEHIADPNLLFVGDRVYLPR